MSVDYRPNYDPADVDSDYGHTGGDITVPTFTGDTRPFRFWCQKALPLVYDDSLSYYEVLCKMADYLNHFMTDLTTVEDSMTEFGQQFVLNQQFLNSMADQLGQNVDDLEAYINDRMSDFMTAYTQLQTYVNTYFDNLDVQEEINTKLDVMASDGTLNDLFDPVLETWMQEKTSQIDNAIAGQNAIQAAQNARISVLEGRMDTFSGLPSGSTSGNAELLDIRTNFLGETYSTAGDAVRASDMIASGFQSIPATILEEWDGNDDSSVYDTIQIDISGYKGGHVAVIGSFLNFQSELNESGKCSVYATNTPGKVEDANAVNYYPGNANSIFKSFTQLTTSISGEERLLMQFAIPDDFAYQYLKIGNFEHGALQGSYTEPLYIVYANSWSKTQVDPTLEIAGAAADAKATGDAIDELNERFGILNGTVGKWIISYVGDGSNHSSNKDQIKTNIKAGEIFNIHNWNSANNNVNSQLFAYYSDGTYAQIGLLYTSNQVYTYTASKDITALGLFHTTTSDVIYYVEVLTDDWICKTAEAEVHNLTACRFYRNGSGLNAGNANAVTAGEIPLIPNAVKISVRNPKPLSGDGNYYTYDIVAYRNNTVYANRKTGLRANDNEELFFTNATVISTTSYITGFGICVHEYDSSGVEQTLRYGDFKNYPLIVRYIYDDKITTLRDINNQEANHDLLNSRHCTNPLTILHFSDLHADQKALKRIIDDADYYYGTKVNDKICTGDIVGNSAEEIASWWDGSVLTCIGNHDTASYSGGVYDWTALSMANRDAYYIAPFESNWGIEHTSGTSYYYKDYSTQHVRLIVMDAMLYTGTPGAEATAQTAWLSNLLRDAITNNLHVLIAIHSPHGGATAENCSFSKYGQGTMPTYNDCNTPQSVIDAVATAITAGLKFIGYIVGHTHQDNIWDAEDNGKQLIYCVTCASTTTAQWKNSDQDRSENVDAYNIITIDTANTLVKIVRGGGADIDDHMRTRKAICFNYSTGEKVGEVL